MQQHQQRSTGQKPASQKTPVVQYCGETSAATLAAVMALTKIFQATANTGQHLAWFVAGGSWVPVLTQLDLPLVRRLVANGQLVIFPLDERYDPAQNNSQQIQAAGIGIQLMVPRKTETLAQFAERLNVAIARWLSAHPRHRIVGTIGIGENAHYAGISPLADAAAFPKIFGAPLPKYVVGYVGELVPPERITTTPAFINTFDDIIGLVNGEGKRRALTAFAAHNTPAHVDPVQLLHEAQGNVTIFAGLAPE